MFTFAIIIMQILFCPIWKTVLRTSDEINKLFYHIRNNLLHIHLREITVIFILYLKQHWPNWVEKRLTGGASFISFAVKTVEWSRGKKKIYHGKKEEGLARRFGGKGARKLFRYETHRAAYRVKGANLKKPLPRLSAPRCGGIKIQKEEAPARGLVRRRRAQEKRGGGEKGDREARVRKGGWQKCGIGKLPCNLSHRRFEPLLSDRAPFPAFLPFLFLAVSPARKRKWEVIS